MADVIYHKRGAQYIVPLLLNESVYLLVVVANKCTLQVKLKLHAAGNGYVVA